MKNESHSDASRGTTEEERRLEASRQRRAHWKRWGPYLSERQWGTVREDYSADGDAWSYFPHDHARSRAYRWGEDGLGGICDRHQLVCFALALWNGRDSFLKERLFGLSNPEGNHGEDVKEYYFYLDSTPTHSYMKFLYKYPQQEFPYARLVEENRRRDRYAPELELIDTGVFDDDGYFDVFIEYAKATPEDILIQIAIDNRGREEATLHLLPTLWFRNTWSWGRDSRRPRLRRAQAVAGMEAIEADHFRYGRRWLACEGAPSLLFTENETNRELFGERNPSPYVKDAFHEFIVQDRREAVNPDQIGTKAAAHYAFTLPPGGGKCLRLRLREEPPDADTFGEGFEEVFTRMRTEADEFYSLRAPAGTSEDARLVQRQAFAGLLWSKQFYHYDVRSWLEGDPAQPPPPAERFGHARNRDWQHLYNADVISMPDKWEFPWYAAWDLAFHCVGLALIDPGFAKEQLLLLLREWYMHPSGQLPAYEWNFSDVNPPVHAWACWRVYKIERRIRGRADRVFLERAFHKLLIDFTWWVNRKDPEGRNVFQGGFLGMDNIGVFDRSKTLPGGGHLEQSDGTSWMAMYCLTMLAIALELARENPAYEDVASKFFEHFVHIAHAVHNLGGEAIELWDEADGFYYDVLHFPDGHAERIKVRSMVGLIPLLAVETLEPEIVDALPDFKRRMEWFIEHHGVLHQHVESTERSEKGVRRLLALVNRERLPRVLRVMLDEGELLSSYGIRSLSRVHRDAPYTLQVEGAVHRVAYEPGESTTDLFGGNSNWRGPIWIPVNFLLIEALQKFHHYVGDALKVEFPTGSGSMETLWEVARDLSCRSTRLFLLDSQGRRPLYGELAKFQDDPRWRDCLHFPEYFHGDTGAGLGASHQTGWTALVAKWIEQSGSWLGET